jgi:hypothetical protein
VKETWDAWPSDSEPWDDYDYYDEEDYDDGVSRGRGWTGGTAGPAVVVWPLDRAFAARAEAGSQWALQELRTRIETGRPGRGTCWRGVARAVLEKIGSQAGLLGAALRAAGGPEVARLPAASTWGWMGDQLRLWTSTARTESRQH